MACRLKSEQEAECYLKITLARRKTCTEAARRSFPGDTSFTQGGFWLANEELLTRESASYSLYKHISLSFPPHFQSLLLSLPLPLLTYEAPPKRLLSCTPHSTLSSLSCFSLHTISVLVISIHFLRTLM